jgi:hypothetical protein
MYRLGLDLMPAAGAGEDGGGLAATLLGREKAVLAVEHDSLHLVFADAFVDRHGAVSGEDVQLLSLPWRIANGVWCFGSSRSFYTLSFTYCRSSNRRDSA